MKKQKRIDFFTGNYQSGIVSTLLSDLAGDGTQELIVIGRNWYDEDGNALKQDSEYVTAESIIM